MRAEPPHAVPPAPAGASWQPQPRPGARPCPAPAVIRGGCVGRAAGRRLWAQMVLIARCLSSVGKTNQPGQWALFYLVFISELPSFACSQRPVDGILLRVWLEAVVFPPRAPGRGWKAAESSPSPAPVVSSAWSQRLSRVWSLLAAPGRSELRRGAGRNQVRPDCAVRARCKPPVPGAGPGQCGDWASGAQAISAPGIHNRGGGGAGTPRAGSAQLLACRLPFPPDSHLKDETKAGKETWQLGSRGRAGGASLWTACRAIQSSQTRESTRGPEPCL